MADKAFHIISDALREQGVSYPEAGARLILDALTKAGISLVVLPESGGGEDDGQEYFGDFRRCLYCNEHVGASTATGANVGPRGCRLEQRDPKGG